MDFLETESGGIAGGAERELLKAARAQTLRYSNFLITISTNVRPQNDGEKDALTEWLIDRADEMFNSFDTMNGNLLKPPGTRNESKEAFPEENKIISVKSRFSVEQGQAQRGQVHAHVLLEVAHEYIRQEDGADGVGQESGKDNLGVHVNVLALREWLNARIDQMQIDRRPEKVYVNCKLLTKGTDNSNKWLTLQYISKDRAKDNDGGRRNLREDEMNARDPELSRVRHNMLRGGLNATLEEYDVRKDEIDDSPSEDFLPPGALGGDPMAPTWRRTTVPPPEMKKTTISAPKFKVTSGMKKYK